ncbi:DGQHR domain-containing protein [Rhodoferax sp.]|uniref:DGQHR domain-containing protein n=1 Tax=Rhodoferax sp. TaxID=50421 RepID=UPI00261E207B|nr:DGQHR domain-containing protein [Rhodoferax sp.]MDD3937979.1 DGQHR domain-containing protein [Rhodoferax sp.]
MKGTSEEPTEFSVKAIRLRQPMGEFFIASIPFRRLVEISYFDVRRMLKEREVEEYLGIQRPLNKKRVEELGQYVNTVDASFPTAVILAVEERCASFNKDTGELTFRNDLAPDGDAEPILYRQIAKVLDGQHRIAGLEHYSGENFDVNVSIFVDIELEDQAYIFSVVNLAQTKVNRSLAYDLFELAKARSPQKTSHNIAVALDRHKDSPMYRRIKRLGTATEGRVNEVLTQAGVVEAVLPLISVSPIADRDTLKRGKSLSRPSSEEITKAPLRGMFVDGRDVEILDVLWNYFSAVRARWPSAWANTGQGAVLPRTNGFRALMRVFRPIYVKLGRSGIVPTEAQYREILDKVQLDDADFTVDRFKPGSSGEGELAATMLADMGLTPKQHSLL